jgi:hypothetical protein
MPWFALIKRFYPVLLIVIAFAGGAFYFNHALNAAYDRGLAAGRSEYREMVLQAQDLASQAQVREQEALIEHERQMRVIEQEAARQLQEVQTNSLVQVRTVERVIRENPEFAAVVRPADLERVRNEQLAAIVSAATQGANAAAKLPRAGVRTVLAPDHQHRHSIDAG